MENLSRKSMLVICFIFIYSVNVFSQGLSFCHTDFDGNETKITLNDGGNGVLSILRDGDLKRQGDFNWLITTNRFPNPEIITVRLSTGIILRFEAITNNPPLGKISMLIDSKDNQYLLCWNYSSSSNIRKDSNNSNNAKSYTWAKNESDKKVIALERQKESLLKQINGNWVADANTKYEDSNNILSINTGVSNIKAYLNNWHTKEDYEPLNLEYKGVIAKNEYLGKNSEGNHIFKEFLSFKIVNGEVYSNSKNSNIKFTLGLEPKSDSQPARFNVTYNGTEFAYFFKTDSKIIEEKLSLKNAQYKNEQMKKLTSISSSTNTELNPSNSDIKNWCQGIKMSESQPGLGYNKINCFIVYKDELYAGGKFKTLDGSVCKNIGKYNGSSWSPVGEVNDFIVNDLVEYKGDLYCGSSSGVMKWDGKSWNLVGEVERGKTIFYEGDKKFTIYCPISSLIVYKNNLYAGTTGMYSSIEQTLLLKWDGKQWSRVDGKQYNGHSAAILEVYNDKLYIADRWGENNEKDYPLLEWDGNIFRKIKFPMVDNESYVDFIIELTNFNNELYLAYKDKKGGIMKWDGKDAVSIYKERVDGFKIFNNEIFFGGEYISKIGKLDGTNVKFLTAPNYYPPKKVPVSFGVYKNKLFFGYE